MEKTYVELKVTFIHIVVMVVGIIIIGAFLFYLGYQAGQSSRNKDTDITNIPEKTEEIQLSENTKEKDKPTPDTTTPKTDASISDEIRLHQLPTDPETQPAPTTESPTTEDTIKPKPAERSPYYSIQVGAFSDQANARKYSEKFAQLGYPTEILSNAQKNKTLFRVRVGAFTNREEAERELKKLEKMENKRFKLVKSD